MVEAIVEIRLSDEKGARGEREMRMAKKNQAVASEASRVASLSHSGSLNVVACVPTANARITEPGGQSQRYQAPM